jgi:signal transduction histidine kinase
MLRYYSNEKSEPMVPHGNQQASAADERDAHANTKETLQSLIVAQERQLSNIARELHDDICQRLAMLSLKIEKAATDWATGQTQVGEQLKQIWRQCSALTGDVQALSHELHPSILDNLGLVTAVRGLCREIAEQTGSVVNFTNANVPDSLPREVSLSLFRLIQEALHNAVKYSGDDCFHVHIEGGAFGIRLEVRDQGVGFDVENVKRNKRGLGLISMRERIQLLSGKIHIDSDHDAGTRIYVWVPLTGSSKASLAAAN